MCVRRRGTTVAQSLSLMLVLGMLTRLAFCSFFLRLRSAPSSDVSSSITFLFFFLPLFSSFVSAIAACPLVTEAGGSGIGGLELDSVALGWLEGEALVLEGTLKSVYSFCHLTGVASLGLPCFCE